jgi:hypothetical protein
MHYCQTCRSRAVVVKSGDPSHCSGQYPFQCCCVCATAAGWKGWKVREASLLEFPSSRTFRLETIKEGK